MQRRFITVGARQLAVGVALLVWSLVVTPPAFSGRVEAGKHPERAEYAGKVEGFVKAGRPENPERMGRHNDRDDDDDMESDDRGPRDALRCEGRQEFVRIEEKVCPPTPQRPAIIVKRACCRNPAGKVHCRGFRSCPNRSPS
jgi:hypothetical protein